MRPVSRPPATPLYWLALGLLAGQLAGVHLAGATWLAGAALVAAALLACARRRPQVGLAALALAVGGWQVGAWSDAAAAADSVARLAGGRAWLRGTIVEAPSRAGERARLIVAVDAARRGADWRAARGRVQLSLGVATQPWRAGDAVVALVGLRQPRNFGNPGEFDYRAHLARRAIVATGYARSDTDWARVPGGAAAALERWRQATAATLTATLPPREAGVAAALLIGDQDGLDDALRRRFARAGVSHVLSISGLHVGLVAAAAYAAARWLLARSERLLLRASVPKLAMAASLLPLGLYAAIAGDNVATLRAELMAGLVAAGLLCDRPREWLAPITAAASALLLVRPGAADEISFQLSFVAVLAIVLGVPRLTARWDAWEEARLLRLRSARWRWLRWLVLSQAVTVCAALATAPLTAWHFNMVSLIAPLANLIVVPLLGMATVGIGLLGTVAVAVLPAAAPPLFALVGVAIAWADAATAWLAAPAWAAVRVPTPTLLELALLYGLLGALVLPLPRWRRALVALCLAGLAIDATAWAVERTASGRLRITFVSVGQGDCTLIEFPGRRVMVVDGGGLAGSTFDVGERIVAPQLWRRKILAVDRLVLSHADFDHYGGLGFVAASFAPPAFWWNGHPAAGPRFAELRRALTEAGAVIEQPAAGTVEWVEGVRLRVLHPGAGDGGADNDRSLTLQLSYGGTAVLLPGDLQAAGEAALVRRWGATLASAVLKVPHHGSATSSSAALLDAVAPRVAVVSAGADNRFGFPAPAVQAAYARRGIDLRRTDRDGAVEITIDGEGKLRVSAARADQ